MCYERCHRSEERETMKPDLKKYLSVALVFVLVSVAGTLGHVAVPMLPPALQAPALGLLASALHWINTWGHGERVMAAVNNAFEAGAAAGEQVGSAAGDQPKSAGPQSVTCSGADPNGCASGDFKDPLPPNTAA